MKRKLRYNVGTELVEKDVNYIPVRFILAVFLAVLETLAVIAVVILCCLYIPYFYLAMWATEIACVIQIASSNENPDYKVPWLLVVLVIPVVGLMLDIMFHSRVLKLKYIRRMENLKSHSYAKDDADAFTYLQAESSAAASQAKLLCNISLAGTAAASAAAVIDVNKLHEVRQGRNIGHIGSMVETRAAMDQEADRPFPHDGAIRHEL